MTAQSKQTQQADFIVAPVAGQVSAYQASVTAAAIDIGTCGPAALVPNTGATATNSQNPGGVDRYVTLVADGGAVYVLFGASAAAVSGANAPDPTATGAAAAGTNKVGACIPIPSGGLMNVLIRAAERFVGYVTASGTATLRVWVSSPRFD
jgi:hypothetical protein